MRRNSTRHSAEPLDEESSSARSRIRSVGEAVVQYMLFRDEVPLTDRIEGTSSFATDFAARGPRDSKGRSLRDFDLKTRIFRYPCSYLIYSRAFDSLPGEVKDHVYQRLWEILNGQGTKKDDPVLAVEDREAILEILRDTKQGLPDYWKASPPHPICGSLTVHRQRISDDSHNECHHTSLWQLCGPSEHHRGPHPALGFRKRCERRSIGSERNGHWDRIA